MKRTPHPIEVESYRLLRGRVDTTGLAPLSRAVVERIVHTTADPTWVGDVVADEEALHAGRRALTGGGPLIADVRMVAAGVTALETVVGLDLPGVATLAGDEDVTRSAAGIRLAAREHPAAAVWAIGNAPTALVELVRLAEAGEVRPALVIGVPVGFVGATESKSALRRSGLPALSTRTERGGAAVAAAAVNALLYFEAS
ncbi:MAG: precorrin-8X methylmutase [Pseudonocardiaceae bacterium]|nr:precorrin-8X methylmutase [Pseudonocardiaceae bacterium]